MLYLTISGGVGHFGKCPIFLGMVSSIILKNLPDKIYLIFSGEGWEEQPYENSYNVRQVGSVAKPLF